MITVKKDRLEDLKKLGFEEEEKGGLFYAKRLRVSEINVDANDGTFFVHMSNFVFEDFMSEITYISNILLSDRYGVNITIDILREKGMLEDE